ncbi:hypothetical protein [Acinetobacter sp. ANC 3813]|uniref:hypothetical protein n=1 Tax=Acinetobacter sp. ANC 3813 TaxID=1977873 RepID=UPI000A346AE7|nr:hypothetical protein [Acinetobacter sp. ANC 3813]OTG90419.1 hypothetical protein B9T34_07915 [Acinetobacter sp. ANC 3813]
MKKKILCGLIASLCVYSSANAMTALDDNALSKVDGQALLSLSKDSYTYDNVNFYKLNFQAEMDINANIKSLQLGCGGVNNSIRTGCDIDIKNLSLSGLSTGNDGTGSPTYTGDRASSSAKITNPFIEFAIKNTGQASTREVVGFRLGAEQILGMLTAGTSNTQNPSDGIQSFSGYMKMAKTTGDVKTAQAKFGDSTNEQISGYLTALFTDRTFTSDSTNSNNTGITVPSITVNFTMPETVVSGTRLKDAKVTGIRSTIDKIPLAAGSGVAGVNDSVFANDQLFVKFPAILLIASSAKFKMDTGSIIKNLNMDITFEQALSMIHNIPLTGTGGYLSMQKQSIKWAGTDAGDIAKTGWWMSFKDPVQLGYLQAQNQVDISSVLPQVATLVTQYLTTEENRIEINALEAIGSLLSVPIKKKLEIDLASYTSSSPATISLTNQILKNQNVTSNCFGGLKFC